MHPLQHFPIIFIIHARSFYKFCYFFHEASWRFSNKQSYGWWKIDWVVFLSFGRRVSGSESIFMARGRVLFATPFDPSLLFIGSFQGETARDDTRCSLRSEALRSSFSVIKRELLTTLDLHSDGFSRTKVKWKHESRKASRDASEAEGNGACKLAMRNLLALMEIELLAVANEFASVFTPAFHFYCRVLQKSTLSESEWTQFAASTPISSIKDYFHSLGKCRRSLLWKPQENFEK